MGTKQLAPAVPSVIAIPEAATLTNINQLCPLDNNLSQTDFATGWNDCRQYALTHDGVPPVIKGVHAAAQGWNTCRAAMLKSQPVIPVEPTAAMQAAGAAAIRFDTTPINKLFTANAVYRAMLAAVPEVMTK